MNKVSLTFNNNRYLVKHMLLFCGIDDRISCSYLNRIFYQEYNGIIPSTGDIKRLLGNIISSIFDSKSSKIDTRFPDHEIILSSYLRDDIHIKDSHDGIMSSLPHILKYDTFKICIMTIYFNWENCSLLYWRGDRLEIANCDTLENPVSSRTIKCNLISMLNNLPILIKKGSPKLYRKKIDWTKENQHGLEWST